MYALEVSERADKTFQKLSKKNRFVLRIIDKKLAQMLANPQHFKPLSGEMRGERRVHVHIESSFVLTYEIDEQRKTVRVLNFEHHDKVYGRK